MVEEQTDNGTNNRIEKWKREKKKEQVKQKTKEIPKKERNKNPNIPMFWELIEDNKMELNFKWKHKTLYHICEIIPMTWCGDYWDNKRIEEGYKFKANFHSRQHTTKYFWTLKQAKRYCHKWLNNVNYWNIEKL